MATVSRGTKAAGGTDFTAHTTGTATEVNTDLNNLVNAHNNHDAGSSVWTVMSAALVRAASGTAGAPSYSFPTDPTTGLFSGGAGTLSVSISGTERFRVNSSGCFLLSSTPLDLGSSKITALAAGTAATDGVRYSQLIFLANLSRLDNTTTTTTSSSTPQATSVTASITPSTSSTKVRAFVSGGLTITGGAGTTADVHLFRGSTDLGIFSTLRNDNASIITAPCSFIFTDSPASTSSTTYTVKVASSDNSHSVQWNRENIHAQIELVEVAS